MSCLGNNEKALFRILILFISGLFHNRKLLIRHFKPYTIKDNSFVRLKNRENTNFENHLESMRNFHIQANVLQT